MLLQIYFMTIKDEHNSSTSNFATFFPPFKAESLLKRPKSPFNERAHVSRDN